MKRALIVDDHEDNRYYLSALLTGHGYAVDTARHGAEALVLARQAAPTIVISDLLMPVLDGYMLLHQWKADERLRHIPFIVYTATYTEPADEALALSLGADAFIVKPAEPEEFMARLWRAEVAVEAAGAARLPRPPADDETLLDRYGHVLARKLEKKIQDLERVTAAVQRESAERSRMAETLSATLNALPAHVALLDADGVVSAVNASWQRFDLVNGVPAAAPRVGESYLEACARVEQACPAEALEIATGIRRVLSGEVPSLATEYPCRTGDGAVWYRLMVTPVRKGATGGAVVMQLDVTQRRELERRVAQAQKLEAIGQLTGRVAHDFNNLLGVISGNLELVARALDNVPELSEMVEAALRASKRGGTLAHSLLAFARLQPLQPCLVDPAALLADMIALLSRTLPATIRIELTGGPSWPCTADPGELQNAVLNLAMNARDAMPQGGRLSLATGNVSLRDAAEAAAAEVTPGDYVVIEVSDTGTGMTADVLGRIFEPFFTTKALGKGTGLGLSMVHGFAKQSLGAVKVESAPGRGTTIRLYLPRAAAATGGGPVPAKAVEACG